MSKEEIKSNFIKVMKMFENSDIKIPLTSSTEQFIKDTIKPKLENNIDFQIVRSGNTYNIVFK